MREHKSTDGGSARRYVSITADAKRTGMSKSWYHAAVRERRLPHYRIGTRILLDPVAIDRFFAEHEVQPVEND